MDTPLIETSCSVLCAICAIVGAVPAMPTYLDKIRGERGLLQEEQRARRRANDAILWWTRRRANESLDDDNDVRETVRHTTVEIQALFSTWMSQPGVESRRRLRAAVRADQRYLRTLATV